MTKVLAGVSVVAFMVAISCVPNHYYKHAEVTSISASEVTVDDGKNYWTFEGDGFKVGDKVKLTMDTNTTDTYIYDDIVVNAVIER